MVSGNGITHSERTDDPTRTGKMKMSGIQTWVALPDDQEETHARFEHADSNELPLLEAENKSVRLILGRAWGEKAPVKVASDMFYADAVLGANAAIPLPDDHEDRGAYVVEGEVISGGQVYGAGQMMIFRPGDSVDLRAGESGARLMLLGGETFNSPRYIWWN